MLYWWFDISRDWLREHDLHSVVQVLDQVLFRALAATGLAFLIVLLLGPRTIAVLTKMKIGDTGLTDAEALRAAARSKTSTPTMGGVLIAGAIGVVVLLLGDVREFYVSTALVVLVWMAALGGVDDWLKLTASRRGLASRQGLLAWEKLVFQIGLGLLVGLFAFRHGDAAGGPDLAHVLNLPFQKTFLKPGVQVNPSLIYFGKWVFVLVAVLMIAGMSNAVNLSDGMDGLAAGITVAVGAGLLWLTLISGSDVLSHRLLVPFIPGTQELAVVAGAMVGACLGFLWWNCSPAQVFMGDTGSLCLGGLIGYLGVMIRQEIVVLLMCGVFLVEIGSVVLQVGYYKASGGKRVFRCAPFHHHLHLGAWTEQQVVVRFWIVSVLLVVLALASIKVR
ncbi:MAG: phospho-N-acetylmuramoyl-pentapeptide-transferase [Phycisphaerales bacterium]|nr:phospho-N-acetylmuramoyl-pentapeptide-transferase [Phycisphaerales bacterium]